MTAPNRDEARNVYLDAHAALADAMAACQLAASKFEVAASAYFAAMVDQGLAAIFGEVEESA